MKIILLIEFKVAIMNAGLVVLGIIAFAIAIYVILVLTGVVNFPPDFMTTENDKPSSGTGGEGVGEEGVGAGAGTTGMTGVGVGATGAGAASSPPQPTNLIPCKIKGVLLKDPWYLSGTTTCIAPSSRVTAKCCNLTADGKSCTANFDDAGYPSSEPIVNWAKMCGVEYTDDNPPPQPPAPPAQTPSQPPPPPTQKPLANTGVSGCPPGYDVKDGLGRCAAKWTATCAEDCAHTACTTAGGTWIPLDYSTNYYTCEMKLLSGTSKICPPGYDTVNGTCTHTIPYSQTGQYEGACTAAGGKYSYSPIVPSVTGTANCTL
jgi:hypothetical protein